MRIELQAACHAPQMLGGLFDVLPVRIGAPMNEIWGIVTDSREVREGDLFVACAGEQTDGRAFISDALKAGACAVLCEGEERLLPKGDFWLFLVNTLQNLLQNRIGILSARVIRGQDHQIGKA